MAITNQLSEQNNQTQLQDYFSIHPFYSEYCKDKSVISGLTPGNLKDLTIDTRKFTMDHSGHLSPNMILPKLFISKIHTVQCLTMEYLSYPSEDFLKKLSHSADSQDCSGSFLIALRIVMHELSEFLNHINWIVQTKSEIVHSKYKKMPPANVRNILHQLALQDQTLCSQISNITHYKESSNRCEEEKPCLGSIKKANATITQLEQGWKNSNRETFKCNSC